MRSCAVCWLALTGALTDNLRGRQHQHGGGMEDSVDRGMDLYRDDVATALATYQAARYRAEGLHEEFLAVLGRPEANVTQAREDLEAAEEAMRRARRAWWITVATERTDPTARQDELVSDAPSGD